MASDDDEIGQPPANQPRGFFAEIFNALAKSFVVFISAFAVGTGVSAAICLYYGVPLIFSLLGGLIVLGIALALTSGGLFF
ncbi:MAG: hypothetical protein ACR2OY_11815 [Boseongicola sp.]